MSDTAIHLPLSPIFVGKVGAYQSGDNFIKRLEALSANIRLKQKWTAADNTLAFYEMAHINMGKMFYCPGPN